MANIFIIIHHSSSAVSTVRGKRPNLANLQINLRFGHILSQADIFHGVVTHAIVTKTAVSDGGGDQKIVLLPSFTDP